MVELVRPAVVPPNTCFVVQAADPTKQLERPEVTQLPAIRNHGPIAQREHGCVHAALLERS